ncbi:MAG: hypothetical protein RLZZ628_2897 [Bacteroidota bacterium]|jgi:hypothetical protein
MINKKNQMIIILIKKSNLYNLVLMDKFGSGTFGTN